MRDLLEFGDEPLFLEVVVALDESFEPIPNAGIVLVQLFGAEVVGGLVHVLIDEQVLNEPGHQGLVRSGLGMVGDFSGAVDLGPAAYGFSDFGGDGIPMLRELSIFEAEDIENDHFLGPEGLGIVDRHVDHRKVFILQQPVDGRMGFGLLEVGKKTERSFQAGWGGGIVLDIARVKVLADFGLVIVLHEGLQAVLGDLFQVCHILGVGMGNSYAVNNSDQESRIGGTEQRCWTRKQQEYAHFGLLYTFFGWRKREAKRIPPIP